MASSRSGRSSSSSSSAASRLQAASTAELGEVTTSGTGEADALKAEADALDALAQRGYSNERLDQLVVDVLLGVR